jgi:hypothetical protein
MKNNTEKSIGGTTSIHAMSRRQFLQTGVSSCVALLGLRAMGKASPVPAGEVSNLVWFKQQFGTLSAARLANTPFDIDFLAAVALQETGYVWGALRNKGLSTPEILESCVGDTLDYPKRSKSAFPKDKAELIAVKNGQETFVIAREALRKLGEHRPAYQRVYNKYPDKFCHGFGIFQYDLQFFKNNPEFFLKRKWLDFDECLRLFVEDELVHAIRKAGYAGRKTLTHDELVYVAIAYNRGKVEFSRGFKQGHKNSSTGKYYGEYIDTYLRLSRSAIH